MVNAQEYIKQFNRELKILDLEGQELEEYLDLSEFTELEELNCSRNELTGLDISKCLNLKKIDCSYNLFDDLSFLTQFPSPEKLIYLNIEENGAFISLEEKVKILMPFINLKKTEEEVTIESLITQLKTNKEQLEQAISNLKEQNSRLEEENNIFKTNQQQFQKELVELKNQVGLTKEEKRKIEKVTQELKKILNQNQENNSQLQNDLEAEVSGLAQKIAALAQENNHLAENLENTKNNFSNLQTQLTKKEARLQELQNSQSSLTAEQIAEKQRLEAELTNLKNKLVDLEQEKNMLSEQLIRAEKELAEKQELELKLKQLKTELTEKKNELISVKKELVEQKWGGKIGTTILRKKIERLETELSSIRENFRKTQIEVKENNKIKTASVMPPQWQELLKEENRLLENHNLQEISYEEVQPTTNRPPFLWEINSNRPLEKNSLPTRLYDIQDEEIIEISEDFPVKTYATLSYVCNDHIQNWVKLKMEKQELELSSSSMKALEKAQEACRLNDIDIDYLWMDKLCINQNDSEEKAKEISKMRDYYSNSSLTLISINAEIPELYLNPLSWPEILKMIISSEWFNRSWTFQEGWLSKQTIFMFDNALIDGREIAKQWVINQPNYAGYVNYNNLLAEGSQKIATPLGWVYCKERYNSEDFLILTLNQALRGIKERKRTLPVDGIYSIIGLLPYSKQVEVDYSLTPQQALFNVMKVSWENGYAEPLAWHGLGTSWLPEVNNDGSVNILGSLRIIGKPQSIKIKANNDLEIQASRYKIDNVFDNKISKIEEGFLIEGGVYTKEVQLNILKNDLHVLENFTLLGTKESLEKVKKNNELLLFNENEWAREDKEPFALLVARYGKIHQRIGVVEMKREQVEKIEGKEEKKVIIKGIEKVWEAQQEIPPKS